MAIRVRVNQAALAQIAKSAGVAAALHAKGEEVAGHIRAQGIRVENIPGDIALPVEVEDHGADTAVTSVIIAHPSGEAVQAKHGAVTAGAAAAGLEVTGG